LTRRWSGLGPSRIALDRDLAIFTTPPMLVDGAEATTVITWRRARG
jgi:hypothetical protein